MKDIEEDLVSLMSDIVVNYDVHGDIPEYWLDQLEILLYAYWSERDETGKSH